MFVLALVLTVVLSLVALVWTSRHFMIWRERRSGFSLTEEYVSDPPADPPMISVVVAAKDEEANIEACVRTMLDQDYPNFEMIVCNDRSTDATASIVQRLARQDRRLRLITIEELPEGWCGKNHAMQRGIATAKAQWICMIDADCRQTSRRTLSCAMQYARQRGADMLSVLPVLEMRGFWENVVQPVCSGVMMIWFKPDKVNDPSKPSAYANGAFMLIRREAYQAIGTHEAVKNCVNEDMHMAARIKATGLNLRVVRNNGLYTSRMYSSLRHIVRGWSRIFFGTFGTMRRLTVSLTVLAVMGLLPYLGAVLGLALAGEGAPLAGLWRALAIVALIAVAMQISVIYRFYGLLQARPLLAWTYPLGCAVAMLSVILAISKLRRGARIVWRSTSYSRPT